MSKTFKYLSLVLIVLTLVIGVGVNSSNAALTLGALTIDSSAALNLGTVNATSLSIGSTGVTTTNNGALTVTQTLTAPLLIGGTETTSDLSLQTTSGVGTTGADMHFLVGNNGATEAMIILNSGYVGVGTISPISLLDVRTTNSGGDVAITVGNTVGYSDAYTETASLKFIQNSYTGGKIVSGREATYGVPPNMDSYMGFHTVLDGSQTEKMRITSAGNIGIGTATPNANAILDLTSTTKAFMPPRMTTTQRDAISSPTAGMVIYNTTTNKLNVYTTAWEAVTSS